MTRSETLLIGLLVVAVVLASAAATFMSDSPSIWWPFIQVGFAIAQITLASAGVVFLMRMLWLRLLVLLVVILLNSVLLEIVFSNVSTILPLSGIALFSTAWCACLRFLGWRIVRFERDMPARQFSLATLLLIMTISAIYLGMLRGASTLGSPLDTTLLLVLVFLAVPGCFMVTATVCHRLAWIAPTGVAALFYGLLWSGNGPSVLSVYWEEPMIVLTSELVAMIAILTVLRFAGIHLGRATPKSV